MTTKDKKPSYKKEKKIYLICSKCGEIFKAFINKENAEKLLRKTHDYKSLKPPFDYETAKQYEQRYNLWIKNHPLFNGYSSPALNTILYIKEFELIDFKPFV